MRVLLMRGPMLLFSMEGGLGSPEALICMDGAAIAAGANSYRRLFEGAEWRF